MAKALLRRIDVFLIARVGALLLTPMLMTMTPSAFGQSSNEIQSSISQALQHLTSLYVKTRVETTYVDNADAARELTSLYGLAYLDDYAFSSKGRLFRLQRSWDDLATLGRPVSQRTGMAWHENHVAFDGERLRFQSTRCAPPREPVVDSATVEGPEGLERTYLMGQKNVYNEAAGCLFFEKNKLDVWWFLHGKFFVPDSELSSLKQERPFALLDALVTGKYQVGSTPEVVNDNSTIVLDWPGHDKLWLAPKLGYAIVRRELRGGDSDHLVVRFENHDFEEIVAGLWLPRRVVREVFGLPSQGLAFRNRVVMRNEVTVVDFMVNSVPDELFNLDFPHNALVVDMTRVTKTTGDHVGVVYRAHADANVTQLALENAIAAQETLEHSQSSSRRSLIFVFATIVACLSFVLIYRRMTSP